MRVAIIGAGPAGSTAAYHLARCGIRVDVYELLDWPRSFCAGGLGYDAIRRIKTIEPVQHAIKNSIQQEIHYVELCVADKCIGIDSSETGLERLGYVIDRALFDKIILSMAIKEGALYHPRSPRDPSHMDTKYDIIIDARGSSAWAYNDWSHVVYTWQTILPGASKALRIVFDPSIDEGYMWLFPAGNTVKVGYGELISTLKERGKKYYLDLLSKTMDIDLSKPGTVMSEVLPLKGELRISKRRTLFVGTAAGLIDPLTGAGIKYAVISGYRLALSICDGGSRRKIIYRYRGRLLPLTLEIKLLAKIRDIVLRKLHSNPDKLYNVLKELKGLVLGKGVTDIYSIARAAYKLLF